MNGLSAAALLDVWEAAGARPPARRALALVAAAGGAGEDPAAVPIARRDAALLELRRLQLGDEMDATVRCPECDEALDVVLDAGALATPVPDDELDLAAGGFEVSFRLPATADVEAAAASGGDVRAAVLGRCISAARAGDRDVTPADLPDEVLAAVEDAMEAADDGPAAALTCAGCGHEWTERLDVASFVWEEVAALARRVTADVHVLASAYGWSESDILALGPARRRLYVEVVTE